MNRWVNKIKVHIVALMACGVYSVWADGAFRPAATVAFTDTRIIAGHVQLLSKGAPDPLLSQAIPNAILGSPVARMLGPMRPGATGVAVCYVDSAVAARLLERHVMLNCRIVPGGDHCEESWERQIPFFMETLLYGLE